MSKRDRKTQFESKRDEYDLNPRKVRGCYISSRNKRILLLILVIVSLAFAMLSMHFQKKVTDEEVIEAEVIRVVDGDTIVVSLYGQEERIRLIGIDAPESVSSNEEENSVFGKMASEYTEAVLQSGMTVFLTFDEEREDKYGRMLAYVWTNSDLQNIDNLFQKQILADGYAIAMHYEPNTMYLQILYASMNEAIMKRQGLWAEQEFYNQYYSETYL